MNKIGIIFMLLSLGLVIGCSEENQAQTNNETQVKTVNVETTTLQPTDFASYLRLVGTVEAANDVRLSAEASGQILRYAVDEGSTVKQGELIAKIDDSQLKKNQARLDAQTKQAKEMYQRQKRLWEQDSIGSEIDYLNAKYQYQQSNAALEAINVQISKTNVRAPFDAIVEDIITEAGEMVNPGMPIVRLIASNYIKVTAGVPARYADVVSVGDSAQIWFDTQSSDTLRGSIMFVGNAIDQQARTFRIEIAMPNHNRQYKIGMIANLKLRTVRRPQSLVISKEFVYRNHDQYVVYIVGKDQEGHLVARQQPIEMGPSYANNVVVANGLQPTDRLITVGSSYLNDGTRIQIVDQKTTT